LFKENYLTKIQGSKLGQSSEHSLLAGYL